ncbi:MAG TPA: YggS family pyridoxal phosphate-dependent enzyme [Deltaproteobacteria bacterium]|nr:YggS family pyridoxal phosphate-dependent enzyme [Deltaproteobacteria bacterium]
MISDDTTGGPLADAILEEARARYEAVRNRIARAAERAGRAPHEITLVGVAKRQPMERILGAIAAGLRVLGESYVQEAREMRPRIESRLASQRETSGVELEWRMVGRLQRNKAGLAARLFDAVESVDRAALADVLSRRAEAEGRILDTLIQVSLCGEPQKGGCEPGDLPELARRVHDLPGLRLRGLMTIPAAGGNPEASRPVFARLRALGESLAELDPELARPDLSMGMSADFEVAIEEGATLVRVGTALFGERRASPPAT